MSELDQIATALAAAQAQMDNATFNKTNPHFKSRYADLAAIREATIPALSANGLAIVQFTSVSEITFEGGPTEITLHTRLIHKSGQFIEGTYPIAKASPQQMGSALTYARRYSWSAMCGMAADDDDDANEAESIGGLQNVEKKSAYRARKDGDWEPLKAGIESQDTVEALHKWAAINKAAISKLPDNWQLFLREAYQARMAELRDGVTEEGKPLQVSDDLRKKLELTAEENALIDEPGSTEPEEAKP